jgi:glutamate--cysteine ligase
MPVVGGRLGDYVPELLPTDTISTPVGVRGVPISELEAERLIGSICFKTGPPGTIGAELEWLVADTSDPALPVPFDRVREILSDLKQPGGMPGAGLLTLEPGGQVELSTAPAINLPACVAAASDDMHVLRQAFGSAGLTLTGRGLDLHRSPSRVLDLPRYAAMEEFFDRRGPWGRLMMCSTASVQVCIDAGLDDDGPSGYPFRWRLMHALGPVFVAAFANSPLRRGKPTGWKCTRQLVWSRLDPCRTWAPPGAEPGDIDGQAGDPRRDMVRYALDAEVLCLRRPDGQPWTVPAGLTFRDWVRGDSGPTEDDLRYHLSTLFPPVRAHGHLELRMIDAQPGDDGWIVPVALVAALAEDPVAAQAAMAAAEPVWHELGAAGMPPPGPSRVTQAAPWLRAARFGPADPVIGRAVAECFALADAALADAALADAALADAAHAALARSRGPDPIRSAVSDFAERYAFKGRCPADDVLDTIGSGKGMS